MNNAGRPIIETEDEQLHTLSGHSRLVLRI